jgi:lysophospholipase L1-like esterase
MHKNKKKREPFSSNAIRLSNWEIIATTLGIVIIVLFALPWIWYKTENVNTEGQFRISTKHRSNYWIYQHWVEQAVKKYPVLFLGDSVVWGMYVDNNNTIPAKLNKLLRKDLVANLAVDGLHCIAAKGLLENYAEAIKNKRVILHFNPLWMQSRVTDLSSVPKGKKSTLAAENMEDDDVNDSPVCEPQINHPRLIPQFSNEITAYNKKLGARMAVLRERYIPFFAMLNHIRLSFFDNEDFNQWIVDHPHQNPLSKIALTIDAGEHEKNCNRELSWEASGIPKQDWKWLKSADSLQWKAFTQVVAELLANGNELCIMVGPINPYMLTPASLKRYRQLQAEIAAWLKTHKIDYVMVKDMPSRLYADASHPLAGGYDLIAKQLLKTKMLKNMERLSTH